MISHSSTTCNHFFSEIGIQYSTCTQPTNYISSSFMVNMFHFTVHIYNYGSHKQMSWENISIIHDIIPRGTKTTGDKYTTLSYHKVT